LVDSKPKERAHIKSRLHRDKQKKLKSCLGIRENGDVLRLTPGPLGITLVPAE
jgi:hypothetical protein